MQFLSCGIIASPLETLRCWLRETDGMRSYENDFGTFIDVTKPQDVWQSMAGKPAKLMMESLEDDGSKSLDCVDGSKSLDCVVEPIYLKVCFVERDKALQRKSQRGASMLVASTCVKMLQLRELSIRRINARGEGEGWRRR